MVRNPICDCNEDSRSACEGEQITTSEGGEPKHYCVLHLRTTNKGEAFEKALQNKIERGDFNFKGVWFPRDVSFSGQRFDKDADFRGATFNGRVNCFKVTFAGKSLFRNATFNEKANFHSAEFQKNVDFKRIEFKNEASFTRAKFKGAAIFRRAVFGGEVDFSKAVFNGAKFKYAVFNDKADFQGAVFNTNNSMYYAQKADFSRVEFRGEADFALVSFNWQVLADGEEATKRKVTADFARTRFYGEADFASATFEIAADFHRAIFNENVDFSPHNTDLKNSKRPTVFNDGADFKEATFNAEANFSLVDFRESTVTLTRATLKDYVRFSGEDRTQLLAGSFDLRHAMVDKPERVSFHSVGINPCWLIDVDVRKFDFTNVKWRVEGFQKMITYLIEMNVNEPYRLLEKLCQRLSINHEENQRYRWASKCRFWAMEARRRERFHGYPVWRLYWWYWLASGYGEKRLRALAGLALIWLTFAIFYMNVGFVQPPNPSTSTEASAQTRDIEGKPQAPARALAYSLGVITLQKPEPRPMSVWAQTLVTVETIIGPLQAALLALAVRRRFMR